MSATHWIYWLDLGDGSTDDYDSPLAALGGKGANLARLRHLGLPVPPGFVITTAAYRAVLAAPDLAALAATDPAVLHERVRQTPLPDELSAAIVAAYRQLGGGTVAVRSSGTAEDLTSASFAGQHDTYLDVNGTVALLDAVRSCWASLWTPRAIAYRQASGWESAGDATSLALAVVVQTMVPAEASGVTFTANPLTGMRDETTISAVRGLGERLVSGDGMSDEWIVRGVEAAAEAACVRDVEGALTAEQALAIAALARRIEGIFGAPQDVEWAIADGSLYVLQARPMTALPAPEASLESGEPVRWKSLTRGGWMRNFRLGEWLPEPVTPLCDSWLLAEIEAGEIAAEARDFGMKPRPPYHVLAHGWYYSSPVGGGISPTSVARVILRHPRALIGLALSTSRPDLAERPFVIPVVRRWREELLPRYQRLVASWDARVEAASIAQLIDAIDAIAGVAGEYLWDFSIVGGHAWKAEHALARFCRRYLPSQAARGHQTLLLGLPSNLPAPYPAAALHAVQSLDWIRPTLGETHPEPVVVHEMIERRARMDTTRRETEAACRVALARHPRQRRRFEDLLALAQRYAVLREVQAYWFTLGWPVLRRAVVRLGEELQRRDVLTRADDVFFLTRAEVELALRSQIPLDPSRQQERPATDEQTSTDLQATALSRRQAWERQRRLSPPLVLGKPLGARIIARAAETMRATGATRTAGERPEGLENQVTLSGMPASPGCATGPVRLVRGPDDFGRFRPGEVIVAQVTAPAWTPLFRRAAAVVTDGGSLAAHASLVAREYGIPAVVAVGVATARLRDGQRVLVDGDRGCVVLLDADAAETIGD